MVERGARYRWSHPLEWLQEWIRDAEEIELRTLARQLAELLDADQIQDLFQSEMSDDGYFDEIKEVSDDDS